LVRDLLFSAPYYLTSYALNIFGRRSGALRFFRS
jgi:hypothetical protein